MLSVRKTGSYCTVITCKSPYYNILGPTCSKCDVVSGLSFIASQNEVFCKNCFKELKATKATRGCPNG